MPANILSLDMDWFNGFEQDTLRDDIDDFFRTLKRCCRVPRRIDLVSEHHYLFPWGMNLLDGLAYRKVNIVNIDEHHDFYFLNDLDFCIKKSMVTCGNFFAFMAHRHMIGKYVWVSTSVTKSRVCRDKRELRGYMRRSKSAAVRTLRHKVEVSSSESVYDVLCGCKFDGFIIVRSPQYTNYRRTVYRAVDVALETHFPTKKVRRYSCRRDYQQNSVLQMRRQFAIA